METRSRRVRREREDVSDGHAGGKARKEMPMNGNAKRGPVDDPKKGTWREWSARWEIPRKILHTSIGFFALYGWTQNIHVPRLVYWLSTALCIIVAADVLRFSIRPFAWLYELLLGFLMRPSEKHGWNGVIFYLVGVNFVLTFLPRDLAVFSIMILSWCDTAASTMGQNFGRYTPRLPSPPFAARKSIAGFAGAFTIGAFAGYAFWIHLAPINGSAPDISWAGARSFALSPFRSAPETVGQAVSKWVGFDVWPLRQFKPPGSTMGRGTLTFVCGLVGAVAESLDVFGLDDNLTLPILSGLGLYAVMSLVG